jgi:hypothetical protein
MAHICYKGAGTRDRQPNHHALLSQKNVSEGAGAPTPVYRAVSCTIGIVRPARPAHS